MTQEGQHPGPAQADVERLWAEHMISSSGEHWHHRSQNRHVIQQFLATFCVPNVPGCQRLVIDQQRVLNWMIQDVAGRSPVYAAERLAVLDRFLRMLVQSGQIDANPLAAYRTRHERRSWRCLARALQAEDPHAALADLYPSSDPAGPLAAQVRSYVDLQQALGKGYQMQQRSLKDLDRFLQAKGVDSPKTATPTLIEGWMATLIGDARWRACNVRVAHRFFGYLRGLGIVTHNPVASLLASLKRLPPSSFKPFLFSQEQLRMILAEAKRLPDHHMCSCRAQVCTTMLTLLSALGLRHGEVRHLRIRDLDLSRQTLFIDQTKFHKSRYVPFGPKVGQCLQQYLGVRNTLLLPVGEEDPLFVTKWRKPVDSQMLLNAFRDILGTLAITGREGQGLPRLHDLRHTFAVLRLLRWYRDGVDVQSRLPALSTFLGHVNPRCTEVYLTITADLLREANAMFHRHFGSLLDEEGRR
jgi:integrase